MMKASFCQMAAAMMNSEGMTMPISRWRHLKMYLPLAKRAERNTLAPLVMVMPAVKTKSVAVCQAGIFSRFTMCLPAT